MTLIRVSRDLSLALLSRDVMKQVLVHESYNTCEVKPHLCSGIELLCPIVECHDPGRPVQEKSEEANALAFVLESALRNVFG